MERRLNKLMSHLNNGRISQEEFITLLRKDLYRSRKEDFVPRTANK